MTDLGPGSEFAGHRIEEVAGKGGMGVVYRATHLRLGRTVALKVIATDLAEDEAFRQRFERECRVAASIDHPHVIPLFEAGEQDGRLFMSMRFVRGTDLGDVIAGEGALELMRAAGILDQVADALDAAHHAGLVHRDVKPANVLIERGSRGEHAYLTDFGLARIAAPHTQITQTGMFVGTLDYCPPEQLAGDRRLDARADVYSLGCVLFHAATARPPYRRETLAATIYAHTHEPIPSARDLVPELPGAIDPVIARALAKKPDERYPSAGDLGRAALAAASGQAVAAPERSVATGPAAPVSPTRAARTVPAERPASGARSSLRGRSPRRWLAIAGAAAAVAAAGAVVAIVLAGSDGDGGPAAEAPAIPAGPADEQIPAFEGVAGQLEESRSILSFLDQNDGGVVRLDVGFPELAGTDDYSGDPASVTYFQLFTECDPPLKPNQEPEFANGCLATSLELDGPENDDSGGFLEHGVPRLEGYFRVDVTGALQMGVSPIRLTPLTLDEATAS